MLFVVDTKLLRRRINLTRDDRQAETRGDKGPFYRIEARDGILKLSGHTVEAEFPVTVYEPGVLFLKVTRLRLLLASFPERTMALQANAEGLMLGNVRMKLEPYDMLLYGDPAQAPQEHPGEVMETIDKTMQDIRRLRSGIASMKEELALAEKKLKDLRARHPQKLFDDVGE